MTGVPAAGGELTRRYWNGRHASAPASSAPASWLREQRGLLEAQPRGRALDVACGLGANALFLAELGFSVDALDISDVAVQRLSRRAAEIGAPVSVTRVDLSARPSLPTAAYQVVIDFFYLERPLLPALADALAPGGLLLFETFAGSATRGAGGGRFALRPGELQRAFAGLEALVHDETEAGPRGRPVARLAARRPRTPSPSGC